MPRLLSVPSRCGRHAHRRLPILVSLLSLSLSLLLLGPAIPARAVLRYSEDSPHAALWQRIYDRMPACWKSPRPVLVQEVSDEEMDHLVARTSHRNPEERSDEDSLVDGCYENSGEADSTPTITLRESLRGEDAALVFAHEYGHFVWEQFVSRAERAQYIRLWRHQKRVGHLVTEYAGDSPEEGFAEAFSFFLRNPALLQRRDRVSSLFLQDLSHQKAAPPDEEDADEND